MKAARNKGAWIWLAVAMVAIATVSRADAADARALTHPVLQFLAGNLSGHQDSGSLRAHGVPRLLKSWSARQARTNLDSAGSQTIRAMLPVFFIGLVVPLSAVLLGRNAADCRVQQSPALPSSFQRPPPARLA